MNPRASRLLFALSLGAPAAAQSFHDLNEVRNPANPYSSMLEIEAGMIGVVASDEDPTVGLDSDLSWDGHVYYRDEAFSARRATLEAYAGRDGLFAGFSDGKLIGDETITRFELKARPWLFYRDGFYRGDNFVPNGMYEGSDYEGYIGFGRAVDQGLYVELGPFYRRSDFGRTDLTSPAFTIPEDYAGYGGRLFVEQSTVQMDRRRGVPRDGFVLTLIGEREWNDSEGSFGAVGFTTELPSAVWRARGRLEWYIPSSDTTTWEIFLRGAWNDEKDRIVNYESMHPLGHIWGDAQARLRIHLANSWTLTPFVHGQFSKLQEEDGTSSSNEFFFGGGAESYFHVNDAFSVHGWYSYLNNESRPSVRIDEDLHGEHMFYLGLVMRFGGQRR
jgi:hypothetical protein